MYFIIMIVIILSVVIYYCKIVNGSQVTESSLAWSAYSPEIGLLELAWYQDCQDPATAWSTCGLWPLGVKEYQMFDR